MLYTVEQVANLLNVSKQTIYNKLKLIEFKDKILIKQGQKYIDDELLSLIKNNLKIKSNFKDNNNLNTQAEAEKIQDIIADDDLLNLNKDLIYSLLEQLKVKDKQIEDLNNRLEQEQELTKNMQVLQLKQQTTDIKALEKHFNEFDNKLLEIRERMQNKKHKKGFLNKIFKK